MLLGSTSTHDSLRHQQSSPSAAHPGSKSFSYPAHISLPLLTITMIERPGICPPKERVDDLLSAGTSSNLPFLRNLHFFPSGDHSLAILPATSRCHRCKITYCIVRSTVGASSNGTWACRYPNSVSRRTPCLSC
ncbi:hypothetical protein M758_12G049000 [Ceratodon purpureus]|uniref:Uncharacterized protein n=1 Tax=Ceratodon purpureus TaxID=3225 RepID=A0A8T0G9D5_CERPU|nr:hypothetical protein KC19_12G046300 [Ceratodon purpureus]KAG0598137.1 hypothetical protein M758_12G049000 [Ceratodon purpureus]